MRQRLQVWREEREKETELEFKDKRDIESEISFEIPNHVQ